MLYAFRIQYAMLCYAMLCWAVLCCAAMPGQARAGHAMPMPCHAAAQILCRVIINAAHLGCI